MNFSIHSKEHPPTNMSFQNENLVRGKSLIILLLAMIFFQAAFAGEPTPKESENVAFANLQPFYKSEKGALIYVRQEGSKVVWLAERFDRKFVSVFKGTSKGDEIYGTYYNTPKGKARGTGSLKIIVSNSGKTLKIKGGNMDGQVLNAIARPSKFPARRKAHYRGGTTKNLTGRWQANNAGSMHLVDEEGVVVGYFFGHQKGSNDRPSTAKVFFGNKSSDKINIEWFDLPLGLSYDNGIGEGKATLKIVGPHALKVIDGFIPGLNHERQTDDTLEILN